MWKFIHFWGGPEQKTKHVVTVTVSLVRFAWENYPHENTTPG